MLAEIRKPAFITPWSQPHWKSHLCTACGLTYVRLTTMRSRFHLLILLVGLAGCSERPPVPPTGRLNDEQLNWYASKATNWLKTEGWRYGWPATIDKTDSIKKELSADGSTVTVRLPTQVEPNRESFIKLVFDRRTGEVTSSGEGRIVSDTFQ